MPAAKKTSQKTPTKKKPVKSEEEAPLSSWAQINIALQNLPVYSITRENIHRVAFCQRIVLYRVGATYPENVYAIRYDAEHKCLYFCRVSPFDVQFVYRTIAPKYAKKYCAEQRIEIEKIDFQRSFVLQQISKSESKV